MESGTNFFAKKGKKHEKIELRQAPNRGNFLVNFGRTNNHFPTKSASSSVYFSKLRLVVFLLFIVDPKIVQKGKHEKMVPGFYMASTWERN